MRDMDPCAECGASLDSLTCDDLFHALLALDHSRQPPWGPLHGVSVSCYLLQHPGRLPGDGGAMAWALVCAYARDGLGAADTIIGQARRGNSHRVKGGVPPTHPGTPSRRDEPRLPFSVTIAEVAVDGTFPAEGFAERVTAWAAATIDAWRAED